MAITTDEILGMGRGPVQPTIWDDKSQVAVSPSPVTPTQPTVAGVETTGVENVSYGTVTTQGGPNNPKTAAEVVQQGAVNVANPQTATDSEHVTSVDEQQTSPKKLSYVEMFQQMSPYKPPTPEELEKERKRQKRESIFAAIGEGISAM